MDGARGKRPIFMIIRESNVEPCKTSWLCVEVRVEVCGRLGGVGDWPSRVYEWACRRPPCDWCAVGVFFPFCVCVKEKRGAKPSPLSPWKAPAGRNCPTLLSYLAEVFCFFFSSQCHLMLNSSTYSVSFFPSFAPQSRLRSGFLDQLYRCRYRYRFFFFFLAEVELTTADVRRAEEQGRSWQKYALYFWQEKARRPLLKRSAGLLPGDLR